MKLVVRYSEGILFLMIRLFLSTDNSYRALRLSDATLLAEIIRSRKVGDKKQYAIYSKKGKRLSRWMGSLRRAEKRLRQIEFFKHRK